MFPYDTVSAMKDETVYVYGLFTPHHCHYVGSCYSPINRLRLHKHNKNRTLAKMVKAGQIEIIVLKKCKSSNAHIHEARAIIRFKKTGQCEFNKNIPRNPIPRHRLGTGCAVRDLHTGLEYPSHAAAARAIGFTGSVIRGSFVRNEGRYIHIQPLINKPKI